MRDFTISVDIEATPERVWEVMSDCARWAEWTPSVTSVQLFDEALAVGGRALIRQPGLPPAKFTVTALEPGRSFSWTTGTRAIMFAQAHHVIEPTPLGARVTLRLRFDGLLGGVMGKKMADLNNRYLAMEAAGLKRFSEEGPRDPSVSLEQWSAEAVRRLEGPSRASHRGDS